MIYKRGKNGTILGFGSALPAALFSAERPPHIAPLLGSSPLSKLLEVTAARLTLPTALEPATSKDVWRERFFQIRFINNGRRMSPWLADG